MLNQEEKWLLEEKYKGKKTTPVFNESLDEIKNKYSWGRGFSADCERLTAGEPLGYIIGHVPFLGCQIFLDSKPLIPRPETEYWTEKAVIEIKNKLEVLPPTLRVLDLCAGSGAIGVAVAKAVPGTRVTFAEIDSAHLSVIEKNISQNLSVNRKVLGDEFDVVESDLFSNVAGTFDFILTNPPYIDAALQRTDKEVIENEPHLALFGGTSGMEIIDKIISESPKYLRESGQLWIEHEPEQAEAIKELANKTGFASVESCPDQYGITRYSVLKSS